MIQIMIMIVHDIHNDVNNTHNDNDQSNFCKTPLLELTEAAACTRLYSTNNKLINEKYM